MAARPRKYKIDIPNLYCKLDKRTSRVYWQYRHPISGVFIGFGTDEDAAKAAATEMNRLVSEQETQQSYALIDLAIKAKSKKEAGIRVKEWIVRYNNIQNERFENGEIRKPTVSSRRICSLILSSRAPNVRLKDVDTKMIATLIDEYKAAGKARMGQLIRAVLIDVFKEAQHAGEVPPGYNPALASRNPVAKVKRKRLTLEEWKVIFEHASRMPPAAQNSMLLALVTGQRIGDIVKFKFSDIWDDHLHVMQSKTGAKIAIPLSLRLDAIDMSLREVVARCRDRVISKYLVHHTVAHGSAIPGGKLPENSVSRYFYTARDSSDLTFPKEGSPPSFHEQRSLSSRLYKKQGIDVKTLLGHSTDEMSEEYADDRGLDWKSVIL